MSASLETATTAEPTTAGIDARAAGAGHGRRLIAAFSALENFPALADSRDRLIAVAAASHGPLGPIVSAVESDIALVVAVLRLANQLPGNDGLAAVENVVDAVRALSRESVAELGAGVGTFDFFGSSAVWGSVPERFRLHALATRSAADLLASTIGYAERDRLAVIALLHDIGKLVLIHAYPGYPGSIYNDESKPSERAELERRELGVDHATVGGVLARRWGLPKSIASSIERHHSDDSDGDAALIRLADMLAHYAHGEPISPPDMLRVAHNAGVSGSDLRAALFAVPQTSGGRRRLITEACPLTVRECAILRELAQGKVYKQIAGEMGVSASTIRTHLYNVYAKLGVPDRAQAVLLATERGWL
jgi:putative nucleotidyltransferase with HDIG domain